jgi:hypothetical protein
VKTSKRHLKSPIYGAGAADSREARLRALGLTHVGSELTGLCLNRAIDKVIRVNACHVTGLARYREAVPSLLTVTYEADAEIVGAAAMALGGIGSRVATRRLLQSECPDRLGFRPLEPLRQEVDTIILPSNE